MASNSIQMKKENSIKIIISKDYWKIDRNLKCKITTLSGSNFILFTIKFYSKTEMFKNRNIKKVIQMTPMTKNGNLISFDKRLLKSTKHFRM